MPRSAPQHALQETAGRTSSRSTPPSARTTRCARAVRCAAKRRRSSVATAVIDGITTRYEVRGSGTPLLMFSPGGFDATLDKWTTLPTYARIEILDRLTRSHQCVVFDRRETGE